MPGTLAIFMTRLVQLLVPGRLAASVPEAFRFARSLTSSQQTGVWAPARAKFALLAIPRWLRTPVRVRLAYSLGCVLTPALDATILAEHPVPCGLDALRPFALRFFLRPFVLVAAAFAAILTLGPIP